MKIMSGRALVSGKTFAHGLWGIAILLACTARAQVTPPPSHDLPAELRNRCTMCHTCLTPTKSDPCLIFCPRVKESTGIFTPDDGPDILVMRSMTRQYGPVVFGHRVHAQMAEMSGGCYGCHHYNETSLKILSCASCHPAQRMRTNVNLPDLKGAYHRQCMDCHRQWSGATECSSCHVSNAEGKTPSQLIEGYTRSRKDHPPVTTPSRTVYRTGAQEGTVVTFHHDDHTGVFGLQCVACHRQEGCISCHDKRPAALRAQTAPAARRDFEELHARCSACHSDNACDKCHTPAEMPRFEHGRSTGFTLASYHARLACSECHKKPTVFAGLKSDCRGCHTGWTPATFSHAVTGFQLDATHADFDCDQCHEQGSYDNNPVCTACHADYVYPQKKPGSLRRK